MLGHTQLDLGQAGWKLLCFSKEKCLFLKSNLRVLYIVFVLFIVFNFVYFCVVTMQESSRQGSLLPPSRWFQWDGGRSTSLSYTSLDLLPSTACTGTHVAGGWEGVVGGGGGFREVIVPVYLPPPHRGFPFPAFFCFCI